MCEILHQTYLADEIYERVAAKDHAEELGRVFETLVGLRLVLAIFIVGCSKVPIRQYLIRFAYGLESGMSCLVVGIFVCMIYQQMLITIITLL